MDKLKYYDIVGHLVPGFIFFAAVGFGLLHLGIELPTIPGGEGVKVLFVTALAYYVGRLLSIIGGVIQPVLYFLWGGKPSRQILIKDTSYVHPYVRERVRKQLAKECQLPEELPKCRRKRAIYLDSIFAHAQSICNKENLGRVADFNATYALHRSLFVSSILACLICLLFFEKTSNHDSIVDWMNWLILAYFIAGTISFFAARKHGYYFVREIIRMYLVHETETFQKIKNRIEVKNSDDSDF